MAEQPGDHTARGVSRRRLLTGLALAGSAGLAGCGSSQQSQTTGSNGNGGGGGGGGGEDSGGGGGGDGGSSDSGSPGERVPTLDIQYWSDLGSYTAVFEASLPGIQKDLEAIGLQLNLTPVASLKQLKGIFNDTRQTHFYPLVSSLRPSRLDPDEYLWNASLVWAGANGQGNLSNYASCDFTTAAAKQRVAGSQDERRQFVNEAQKVYSKDVASISMAEIVRYGAYRNDQVNAEALGKHGLQPTGPRPIIMSEAKGDNDIAINTNPTTLSTEMFFNINATQSLAFWNHQIYSPLVEYNQNYELENVLADNIEVSNEGKTFEITLKDATFHNGEPITAEDVRWTYDWISRKSGNFPKPGTAPYKDFEVVDDKTVIFNMKEPFLQFTTRLLPSWGVLPKKVWTAAGAEDNPRDVSLDPIVGSGPYKVTNFRQGQFLLAEPHDGHPTFTPSSNLSVQVFQDIQSANRAFQDGEINMFLSITSSIAQELGGKDYATVAQTKGFLPYAFYPNHSFGPAMFRELRMAMSHAIDRDKVNQNAYNGDSRPLQYANPFSKSHPWYAPEDMLTKIADQTSANPSKAKQILTDAGWSFDDNGRLRYPEDADLSPLWPKGSEPMKHPQDFPCVSDLKDMGYKA